jgi:nucleotide-binding universal stress UspA family protein
MRSGPVVIGYDGTAAATHALREAGSLLGARPALVVVVWKEGLAYDLIEEHSSGAALPAAALDVRTAQEYDEDLCRHARELAEVGASLAREAGFDAEGLCVAEAVEVTVAETLVDIARERDAQAVVVGPHGAVGSLLFGVTTRDVIRHAPCPVVAARGSAEG